MSRHAEHEAGADLRQGARVALDSLTALRAFAALAVFSLHAQELLPGGGPQWLTRQGGVGVPFFFVLSGFVLTWSAREQDSPAAFWRRRAARIVPAYLVGAVLAAPVIVLEGHAVGQRLAYGVPSLALVQAWVPLPDVYFGGNGVLWSLSVEVVFYALFPFVIPHARRLGSRAALVAAVALIAVEVAWQGGCYLLLGHGTVSTWARLVFPVAHLPEFALGVVLALLVQRGQLGRVRLVWAAPLALAAYVASGWAVNDPLVLGPLALLIVGAANSDLARRHSALRARPLVVLGEWSYCFYLLHQLVIRTVAALAGPVHGPALGWASWTIALSASVLLALALYRMVERPLARRVRGRAVAPAVTA